jgi:hypothetical protein
MFQPHDKTTLIQHADIAYGVQNRDSMRGFLSVNQEAHAISLNYQESRTQPQTQEICERLRKLGPVYL